MGTTVSKTKQKAKAISTTTKPKPNFGKDPNLKKEDFIFKNLKGVTAEKYPG